jgi:hypothetical protein
VDNGSLIEHADPSAPTIRRTQRFVPILPRHDLRALFTSARTSGSPDLNPAFAIAVDTLWVSPRDRVLGGGTGRALRGYCGRVSWPSASIHVSMTAFPRALR